MASFTPFISTLPLWYQLVLVALLGAVLASFINVVVYRMHTGASLAGRSRCFSCGHDLRWYELLPVVSFLLQRGSCRYCRAKIPRRDAFAEWIGAGLFMLVFVTATSWLSLVWGWVLVSLLLAVALYDITHFIIPDELVLMIAFGALAYLGWTTWPPTIEALQTPLVSVLVAAGLYAALWKYSGGRWIGFGDVKLAAALGLLLSVEQAFSMVVLSFWIGAAVGLLLIVAPVVRTLVLRTSSANQFSFKSEIPFAPFIVVAFLVVYMYDISVLTFFVPWF